MMASKFAPFIARGRISGTTADTQTKFAPWITWGMGSIFRPAVLEHFAAEDINIILELNKSFATLGNVSEINKAGPDGRSEGINIGVDVKESIITGGFKESDNP